MRLPQTRAARVQLALLLLLVVAVAWGVGRALHKREATAAAARSAAQSLQEAPVYRLAPADVIAVTSVELVQAVPVSGSLKALQTAAVKARAAGELRGLSKREGDPVRAGEELARIDPTEAQARVRQAEQQAASAEAQVAIAQRTQRNNEALVTQGFISPTALDTSSANLAAAQANHRAALAALDIARKGLADTVLRSPLDGQVSARLAQNGERVALDARVLEVVDLSAFEIEAAVSPGDAAPLAVGQSARLRIEGLPAPVDAVISRINPSVQAGSRSVLVYLTVKAAPGMRQGLFAQGTVAVGKTTATAVPQSAVRNDQPQPYVQVLRDGVVEHVALRDAVSGLRGDEPMRAVPLPAGTPVLAASAGALRAGTRVQAPDAR